MESISLNSEWTATGNLRDPPSSRMMSTQLIIASIMGISAICFFNVVRNRFPHIFMARLSYLQRLNDSKLTTRDDNTNTNDNRHSSGTNSSSSNIFVRPFLKIADKSFLQTLITLHRISDEEVIDFAGLDAYVFLSFFKMAINLLFVCWAFAVLIISPVRYYYTGSYDQGDDTGDTMGTNDGKDTNQWYHTYLLLYVIFTYLFTYIACHYLVKHAKTVIEKRQQILGKQNSITDRTIRVSGIPPELRTERKLKETIENLHIGTVKKIVICKEWKQLDLLFKTRSKVIHKLEFYWANYLKANGGSGVAMNIDSLNTGVRLSSSVYSDTQSITSTINHSLNSHNDVEYSIRNNSNTSQNSLISTDSFKRRPKIRLGFAGLLGEKVDALDYFTNQLSVIDEEIENAKKSHYAATPTAFVTMDSVATAQTLAQAVIDPRIEYLITSPAPAPADIIWDNATLPNSARKLKIYYITVISGILGVIFIFPVGYLATLLNYKSIKKFWPDLAKLLLEHEWAGKIVIELLPVYLYTMLNGIIPFLYVWLSSKQGFISHGEEELSVVSKNFFYVFVNLFLVFTMAGTASNYWGYLSDSKKLALQLAQSLRGLSSFYVDTIILQGIGLMPFKLLPIGRIFQYCYFWLTHSTKPITKWNISTVKNPTARELTSLYQPPNFNFGLQLPHPLLTLVITMIYSVISTKILSAGLLYFIIGFYVYKFLLIYTYVHPQHSTGKVMPIIFRRFIFGLLLFQLTVAGTLVLEKAWILAVCLAPLPVYTMTVLWYFQDKLKPLSIFISLRAIEVSDDVTTGIDYTANTDNYDTADVSPITNSVSSNLLDSTNVWKSSILNDSTEAVGRNAYYKPLDSIAAKNLKTSATIDERREQDQSYDYPPLVNKLEGPWIGFDNQRDDEMGSDPQTWILMWTNDGIKRKRITNELVDPNT